VSEVVSAVEILRELVAIATPSSLSNLPLLRWVTTFLERRGWRTELLPYEDERGVAKANLIAWPHAEERDSHFDLAFVCHTDTVPFSAEWAGALTLEERDGQLHGCGSCDVKGAMACFLAAAAENAETHLSHNRPDNEDLLPGTPGKNNVAKVGHPDSGYSIGLILTADEEVGCKGMERLLTATQLSIGAAIVSEPTSVRAGIAGKGYGLARITVEGREAHSAFPRQGVSAISIAARLIVRIEDVFNEKGTRGTEDVLFDPPRTTLNIGVIEGGTAKNIVPGRCTFLVEWRAIPGEAPTHVLEQLRGLIDEAQAAAPDAVIQLDGLRAEAGFSPAVQGDLQRRLVSLLPGEPMGISFGSEASRLARVADEVIVIGPGDMRTAHSDRECVPVAELEAWTGVLAALLRG
jgi:acetylornithine deacetylase